MVAERRTDVGERLGDSSVAFVVVQTSPLKLRFRLPERYLSRLRPGQAVRAKVDPYPGETFTGRVSVVNGIVDSATRTVGVETEFPNRDGRLSPGLFARVEVDRGADGEGGGAMRRLAAICIERPVFATVLILSLVVVGFVAYFSLGVDRFPKVDFPTVSITTRLVGAGPEEIETEITDKIEEAVNTISGMDQLISDLLGRHLGRLLQLRAGEERRRGGPGGAGPRQHHPRRASPTRRSRRSSRSGTRTRCRCSRSPSRARPRSRDITEFADKTLKRQIESIAGVGQARIVGGRPRQINVIPDTARSSRPWGSPPPTWCAPCRARTSRSPAARWSRERAISPFAPTAGSDTPEEFGDISILSRNGYPVKVRDAARIEDGVADAETIARVDGKPAVLLQIRKQSGTNTIEVIDRVKERMQQLAGQLPKGWTMAVVRDQSAYITAAVDAVQEHLMLGSLLAAGIVLLFLRRFRLTVIAAVAIPTSLIASFAAMELMGFTLNVITLLALALVVGIVIDDAVVVLENIFRFLEEKKLNPREAALQGTGEIALAVLATSLSLVAVFLPVAFMGGIVGRFMNSFGITMAFAILVSLLVSFTLTPMMCSRWLKQPARERRRGGEDGGQPRARGSIPGSSGATSPSSIGPCSHRWVVVLIMILVFVSTIPLFLRVNKNFLPQDDESQFEVVVRAPEGSSLQTTERIMASIAAQVRRFPEVKRTVVTIGDDPQVTRTWATSTCPWCRWTSARPTSMPSWTGCAGRCCPHYSRLGLRSQVAPVSAFGGGNNAEIQFWLGGPDLDKLAEYSDQLLMPAPKHAGRGGRRHQPDRGQARAGRARGPGQGGDLAVRVEDIASTLNVLVGGQEVTTYSEGGEQYEVHVRAEAADRRDLPGIEKVAVPAARKQDRGAARRRPPRRGHRPLSHQPHRSGGARCSSTPTCSPATPRRR